MKILAVSGSARRGSFNTALAQRIADIRTQDQVVVRSDLDRLPFFNADLESTRIPPEVAELREAVEECALLVLVTPEYNGTTPGLMMNAVEWLSRPHGTAVLIGKPTLIISASPSRGGGRRSAQHLREVLQRIGAQVCDSGMSVAEAHQEFASPSGGPSTHSQNQLQEALEVAAHGMTNRAAQQHLGDLGPSTVPHTGAREIAELAAVTI